MADIQKAAIDSILAEIPAEASEGTVDWSNPCLPNRGRRVSVRL